MLTENNIRNVLSIMKTVQNNLNEKYEASTNLYTDMENHSHLALNQAAEVRRLTSKVTMITKPSNQLLNQNSGSMLFGVQSSQFLEEIN